MIADRIGLLRYYQNVGQSYAEMCRGSMTASGVVTAAAVWLGVGKVGAVLIGAASMAFWVVLAVGFGWAAVKWRVWHGTIQYEWDNNPVTRKQLELLEEIAKNTRVHGRHR